VKRIGVFVCHCGSNIAGTVDCHWVAEEAKKFPYVVYSTDYQYVCSEPGQDLIKEKVKEHKLDRIVVASCSPRMHEETFRKCFGDAGGNPYLMVMTNLREQVSWVHAKDKEEATKRPWTWSGLLYIRWLELFLCKKIIFPLKRRPWSSAEVSPGCRLL